MSSQTTELRRLLAALERRARARGLSDAQWEARARLAAKTLMRLRAGTRGDFSTLYALARAVGARIVALPEAPATTADGLYPASPDRDWQTRLLDLCASGDLDMDRWRLLGPAFFMAGVAVMLASAPGFDRRALLKLAEQLHAGSTQVGVFTRWLERSPIRPSIFLPLLGA